MDPDGRDNRCELDDSDCPEKEREISDSAKRLTALFKEHGQPEIEKDKPWFDQVISQWKKVRRLPGLVKRFYNLPSGNWPRPVSKVKPPRPLVTAPKRGPAGTGRGGGTVFSMGTKILQMTDKHTVHGIGEVVQSGEAGITGFKARRIQKEWFPVLNMEESKASLQTYEVERLMSEEGLEFFDAAMEVYLPSDDGTEVYRPQGVEGNPPRGGGFGGGYGGVTGQ